MSSPNLSVPGIRPVEDVDVAEPTQSDRQFFSVTTILKALSSPALEYWAIKTTATAAIDNVNTWRAMFEDQGMDETVKWLCGARYRRPKLTLGADQLGTVVHKLCEEYSLSGHKPDRIYTEGLVRAHAAPTVDLDTEVEMALRMLDQFDTWAEKFQPEYTAAEMAVFSEQYGYAGSLDAILTIGGVRTVTDYKTRREPLDKKGNPQRPYGETALQLAAYRHADLAAVARVRRVEKQFKRYYLLNGEEKDLSEPVPEVDGGLCILLTPESCAAYPMRCDAQIFDFFLYALEIFRWEEDVSKRVVGHPLIAEEGAF